MRSFGGLLAVVLLSCTPIRHQPPTLALSYRLPTPLKVALLDARARVLSGEMPPSRTGTRYSTVGIPSPEFGFGRDMPVATGLGYRFNSYLRNTAAGGAAQVFDVPVTPSRDLTRAIAAVTPGPQERFGLLVVINEWFTSGYATCTFPKELVLYVIGPGGVVLAQSQVSDGECVYVGGISLDDAFYTDFFGRLLNAPSVAAVLQGNTAPPPTSFAPAPPPPTPAPTPVPAPTPAPASTGSCSEAQLAKMQKYGFTAEQIRAACTSQAR